MAAHPPTFPVDTQESIPLPAEGSKIAIEAAPGRVWYWRIQKPRRFGPWDARATIVALTRQEIDEMHQRFDTLTDGALTKGRWRRFVDRVRRWRPFVGLLLLGVLGCEGQSYEAPDPTVQARGVIKLGATGAGQVTVFCDRGHLLYALTSSYDSASLVVVPGGCPTGQP